jgi:hypothetical protein
MPLALVLRNRCNGSIHAIIHPGSLQETMTPDAPPPIAPGTGAQLLHLIVAVATALVVGLAPAVWRRLGGRRDDRATRGRRAARPAAAVSSPAVIGALAGALLLLPLLAGLRQLWPHPALRAQLLVVVVAAGSLVALGTWCAGRGGKDAD